MEAKEIQQVASELTLGGALRFRMTPTQGFVAIVPYIYTWAIQCHNTKQGYAYRYCYPSLRTAMDAAQDWEERGWQGEPKGYIARKPDGTSQAG